MAEFIEVMKKRDEICDYEICESCLLHSSKNKYGIGCNSFIRCHPQEAEEIIMN